MVSECLLKCKYHQQCKSTLSQYGLMRIGHNQLNYGSIQLTGIKVHGIYIVTINLYSQHYLYKSFKYVPITVKIYYLFECLNNSWKRSHNKWITMMSVGLLNQIVNCVLCYQAEKQGSGRSFKRFLKAKILFKVN